MRASITLVLLLTFSVTGLTWQRSPDTDGMDVHGAGAQRSDPKAGDPTEFPNGRGSQGDAIRIYNFVRVVRDER